MRDPQVAGAILGDLVDIRTGHTADRDEAVVVEVTEARMASEPDAPPAVLEERPAAGRHPGVTLVARRTKHGPLSVVPAAEGGGRADPSAAIPSRHDGRDSSWRQAL